MKCICLEILLHDMYGLFVLRQINSLVFSTILATEKAFRLRLGVWNGRNYLKICSALMKKLALKCLYSCAFSTPLHNAF